ncbi:hypothetical protein ZIOFF_041367 [Zingiber officinale]|uniref:F-box domain-containing protein n=1 Tax=Zingiber officinale TaxID=94328 RepID=A0A8J5G7I2_ZINOF|nr:hypothetical protein ZIOFF_041367 [Zingiber officinale]
MKRSRARRTMTMKAELIPGLPDCLALECLLRLPFHAILDARAVCKRWKHELDSPSFYRIRRTAGLAHRIVSLLLQGKLPHTIGTRASVRCGSWPPTVPTAMLRSRDEGWRWVGMPRSLGESWWCSADGTCWKTAVVARQKVLVIGGRDAEGKKLQSALAYNVAADTWIEMLDFEEQKCQEDDSFCDKFWQSKEEYNSAILCCRKWLLVEDEDDVRICPTGKEIYMSVPEEKKSDSEDKSKEKVMVTKSILNRNVLRNLRQRLGLRPNEVALYLESYYSGRL